MSAPWKETFEDGTEVVRTCAWSPPGCHPVGCGIRLFVKDGELVKVEGDPEHPVTHGRLCARCLALKEVVYHKDRVLYPMKRAKEDRGKNKWERVSWDEAYDIVAENYWNTVEKYGKKGIAEFTGTGRIASCVAWLIGAAAFGTPNQTYMQSGWSCFGPRMAVCAFIAGVGMIELDTGTGWEKGMDDPHFQLPECIVLWGKMPLASNPDGLFGHSVIDMMKRGTEIVMIDPRMNWLACHSKYVLRVRPGTDTAMGLALLRVIIDEGLEDAKWLDKWAYGWEELKARVREYNLQELADTCDVTVEKIREVARYVATAKPVAWSWGVAMDQSWNGMQTAQTYLALAAATGSLDVPGGTSLGVESDLVKDYLAAGVFNHYCDPEDLAQRIGDKEYPFLTTALGCADPDMMLEAMETDEPYPIRMVVIQGTNNLSPSCCAQPERHRDALKRMDFVMAIDMFQTPTTMACADLFLPISTFPEINGLVCANYGLNSPFLGAINKAIEVGDTKDEVQICLDIIRKVNPKVLDEVGHTVEEFHQSRLAEKVGSFQNVKEHVTFQPGEKYRKYETGDLRPDGNIGFGTPTGRLELYSTIYAQFGEDPLPYYMEPNYSPFSTPELAEEYPLIFTSGHRKTTSFHSEHRHIKVLRDIDPDPIITIHPKTAEKYGIGEGDWVEVYNMFGKARLRAKISSTLHEQVVHCTHGWWYPEQEGEEPNLFGNWKSNVNTLVPHKNIGKLGYGAPFKSCICNIKKVDGLEG